MTIDDHIEDEKLQYDINRETGNRVISMNILLVKKYYHLIKSK